MDKILLLSILLLCIACKDPVKIIYSPDKSYFLSEFEYVDNSGSYTIFTYGNWDKDQLPESYIKVKNSWRDTWYGLIKWNGSEVILYHPYGDFEANNLDNSLLKLDKMQSVKQFFQSFFDEEQTEFIKISSLPDKR